MNSEVLLTDDPAPGVRRLTMNRPDKRNALDHELRGAIVETLRDEGLMLDPVYTSKSFAGALAAAADIGPNGGTVLYLHTGGLPALFAYEAAIDQALAAQDPQSADGQSTLRKEP